MSWQWIARSGQGTAPRWRWTAQRVVISAFVLFHLGALSIWTNPDCLIKSRCALLFRYYVLPLGLWQWWAIFAPDPLRDTLYLNVEVIDSKGLRHLYEFPKIGDLPWWQKLGHYRAPKFAANMPVDEYKTLRTFTAACRPPVGTEGGGISADGQPLLRSPADPASRHAER